jgi:hypothetical protein
VHVAGTQRQPVRSKGSELVGRRGARAVDIVIGYQIDRAAQRIRAETHRDDAAIDLDTVDEVDRDIGDSERIAREIERHAVEEDADLVTGETVERKTRARSEPAFTTHAHAFGAGQHLAEVGGLSPSRFGFDDVDGLRGPAKSFGLGNPAYGHVERGLAGRGLGRGTGQEDSVGQNLRGGRLGQPELVTVEDARRDWPLRPTSGYKAKAQRRLPRGLVEALARGLRDFGLNDAPLRVDGQPQHDAALLTGRARLFRIHRIGELDEPWRRRLERPTRGLSPPLASCRRPSARQEPCRSLLRPLRMPAKQCKGQRPRSRPIWCKGSDVLEPSIIEPAHRSVTIWRASREL